MSAGSGTAPQREIRGGTGVIRLLRFLLSGAAAAAIQAGLLYLLTDRGGVWYLWSSTIAFLAGTAVSFSLQRGWTFGDRTSHRLGRQAVSYLALALVNLAVNGGLMYLAVELLRLHYVVAQLAVAALIAGETFLLYRIWIFRPAS